MIFSQRYMRAIGAGQIVVDLSAQVRNKVWMRLRDCNTQLGIQRDPNDRWIDNSSALEEASREFQLEMGWEQLPVSARSYADPVAELGHYFAGAEGPHAFDIIELAYALMETADGQKFKEKANEIFDLHECPWRLSDGQMFKLDADFVGARLAVDAYERMSGHNFHGATDEYGRARQALASGETRDAIYYAGHSFESVMKTITGLEHVNADQLIKALGSDGYFDDLPESVRAGFSQNVLYALPLLRNKLGGHGQGAQIIKVPIVYADLAVQLAAALNNFLISKHLERNPPAPPPLGPPPSAEPQTFNLDDEIPF